MPLALPSPTRDPEEPLNEYAFRRQHRLDTVTAFRSALGIAVRVAAPTYADISAAGRQRRGGWTHVNPRRRSR